MPTLRKQKYLNAMIDVSRFLAWAIPIYIATCFSLCSFGGLRFVFSHFSNKYRILSDVEKLKFLVGKQSDYCLYAIIVFCILVLIQCVLVVFIRNEKRNFEKEVEDLKKSIFELSAQNAVLLRENHTLKEQLKALSILRQNIATVFQNYLDSVAVSLNFTAKERITLYVVDPERKTFNVIKRYAQNSKWRTWSEISCPLDIGVRGRAWQTGSCYVGSFPDFNVDTAKYRMQSRQFGYTNEQTDAFLMKSRTYFAYRYDSGDKQNHDAVVVIESMTPHYQSKARLLKEVKRCGNLIYQLVKDFYDFIPRGPIATKEGL